MEDIKTGLDYIRQLKQKAENVTFGRYTNYLESKARETGTPLHVHLELTPLCNLDCKMCYVHTAGSQLSGRRLLSADEWKSIIKQAYELGMIKASLTGGECLSYPGFDEIYLYLHSLGCEVNVLTNGVLLNSSRIEFFRQHPPARIQVSLYGSDDDGYERVTGKRLFTTVRDNLIAAEEANLPVSIAITPNKWMRDDVCETIRLASELSKKYTINPAIYDPRNETGRSGQELDMSIDDYIRVMKFAAELKGESLSEIDADKLPKPCGPHISTTECGIECGAGRSCFSINWKGEMHPCLQLDSISEDVLTQPLKTAWEAVNTASNRYPRIAECIDCSYRDVCNRCPAYFEKISSPGILPKAWCERTVKHVQQGVFHIRECED